MRKDSEAFKDGFDYACGVLLREETTVEVLEARASEHTTEFDYGILEAIRRLEAIGALNSSDTYMSGFKKRELLSDQYWKDPLWKEVRALRDKGRHSEANGLVCRIRAKWGL
jgi:hypothetical protein